MPPGRSGACEPVIWWVVPADSVCISTALLLAFKFFCTDVAYNICFKKSAANIFQVKFGDHCFRCLIVLVAAHDVKVLL